MKKQFQSIRVRIRQTGIAASSILTGTRGELATNTIGGIIVAVVIIGLLILAINQFFPNFFQNMFDGMEDKLNANW